MLLFSLELVIEDNTEGSTSLNPINIDSDDDKPIQIPIVKVHSSINDKEGKYFKSFYKYITLCKTLHIYMY